MKLTAHSEYHPIHSLLVQRPDDAFMDQQTINTQWKALNYNAPPHLQASLNEHADLIHIMAQKAHSVHYLSRFGKGSIDSIYTRDASIMTDFGAILCRMGKGARKAEPEHHREFLSSIDIPILGVIETPGTVEGGDVAWINDKTLAVGHGYRTNSEGIEQLTSLLEPKGISVVVASMPHYKGPEDVFHLMSVFSPVDERKAVVFSPLMPVAFRNFLLDHDFKLIEVPEKEFNTLGCNVLAIAPGQCIAVDGNPVTAARMRKAGCNVMTYTGKEISLKGEGGPTCLTRPLYRSKAL